MAEDMQAWVGRVEEAEDRVSLTQARALAATLDMDAAAQGAAGIAEGGPLPALWHWIAFLPQVPMAGLGPDGHPARGGFLPPVPLERRMWAGGRLSFRAPLRIGETIRRRSEIVRIAGKEGSTGRMVFVTLRHRLEGAAGPAIDEEQDLVYVAMPDAYAPPPPVPPPAAPDWQERVAVDTVRLFRFSAVTFNAHRIHFDLPYATAVEKYPGLVVHGPLQAILLMEAARRRQGAAMPDRFAFRGVRPLFHFDGLTLAGQARPGSTALSTVADAGHVCMQAEAHW